MREVAYFSLINTQISALFETGTVYPSAGNLGGSAVRRLVGHGSAATTSKLVALLPNYVQIVQNWLEKDVVNIKLRYATSLLHKFC